MCSMFQNVSPCDQGEMASCGSRCSGKDWYSGLTSRGLGVERSQMLTRALMQRELSSGLAYLYDGTRSSVSPVGICKQRGLKLRAALPEPDQQSQTYKHTACHALSS